MFVPPRLVYQEPFSDVRRPTRLHDLDTLMRVRFQLAQVTRNDLYTTERESSLLVDSFDNVTGLRRQPVGMVRLNRYDVQHQEIR